METESYVEPSLAKAQRSIEIADEIFELCKAFLSDEDKALLIRMGALLGDFSNNLRSSLNYCSRVILQENLLSKMEPRRTKRPALKLDFPWAKNRAEFDGKPIVKVMKEVSNDLYQSFERFQPYYIANEWLAYLMMVSNRDKHEVINRVTSPTASSLLAIRPDGTQLQPPAFVGDKLVIFGDEGIVTAKLPYYYFPFKAFATPKGTWSLFLVPISRTFNLDLIHFTRTSPQNVIFILAFLNSKFGHYLEERTSI